MNELSRMEVRADDIIQYGYIAVKQFPKSEKFVLATRITDLMWEMAALISSAIDAQYNSDKIRLMKEADKELRKLRIMVRNSMKLGFRSAYRTTERLLGEALINARPLLKNKEVV